MQADVSEAGKRPDAPPSLLNARIMRPVAIARENER
jgi:hypothetical protein